MKYSFNRYFVHSAMYAHGYDYCVLFVQIQAEMITHFMIAIEHFLTIKNLRLLTTAVIALYFIKYSLKIT